MSSTRKKLVRVLSGKSTEEIVDLLYATRALDDILSTRVIVLDTLFDMAAERPDTTASLVLDITVSHSVSRSYVWKRLAEVDGQDHLQSVDE